MTLPGCKTTLMALASFVFLVPPIATAQTAIELLREAEKLAWVDNWAEAGPLFARAEALFSQTGEERNAIYARIGKVRNQSESLPYAQVSEFFAGLLEEPTVQQDARLRLWCLAEKVGG